MRTPSLIALLALSATSQADELTHLPVVNVTSATKTERALEDSPVSVELITEQQIQDINAVTLRDIFMELPGVFINPGRGEMSIRGAGAKGSLLLIDGRRISGEVGMGYELNRIPAASIERIEIVKGPMGVLYGSDALGGIINIITKKPTKALEGMIGASAGANTSGAGARYQLEGDLRGKAGATGFSSWISAIKTQAYAEDETTALRVQKGAQGGQGAPSVSDFGILPNGNACLRRQKLCGALSTPIGQKLADSYALSTTYREPSEVLNLGGRLEHAVNEALTLGMDASYMHETREGRYIATNHPTAWKKDDGTGTALPAFGVPVAQTLDNTRYDLAARASWQIVPHLSLNWRSYLSHYEKEESITALNWKDMGYRSEADSASVSGTGKADVTAHELSGTWKPAEEHTLLAGVEHREEKRSAPFFSEDGAMSNRDYRFNSVFAQHEWTLTPALGLVYGLRYDDISTGDTATTGNIGLQYTLSPLARLRASFAQGFRAPDLPETFMTRLTPQGRLLGASVVDTTLGKTAFDLKPERSNNVEIGLGGASKDWSYDLAAFHNRIDDRIEQVVESPKGVAYRTWRNISNARIQGLEARTSYRLLPELWLNASISLLDAKNQDTGQRLEFTPEHLLNLSADWRASTNLKLKLSLQHVGDQFYTDTRSGSSQSAVAGAYTLVNLKASYTPDGLQGIELYAGVDNLFNAKVDTILGSNVGPYLYAGVRKFF
ncbi:MAG: TonB-dependent receptor [Pseudomonadota bacterium]